MHAQYKTIDYKSSTLLFWLLLPDFLRSPVNPKEDKLISNKYRRQKFLLIFCFILGLSPKQRLQSNISMDKTLIPLLLQILTQVKLNVRITYEKIFYPTNCFTKIDIEQKYHFSNLYETFVNGPWFTWKPGNLVS